MGASRNLAIGALAASLLLALAVFLSPAGAQQGTGGHYVGVATCAGSTCHGRSEANGAIVRQDELRLWQDPSSPAGAHSRAWQVLAEPRAKAIAARLGIGEAASAPMCLGCHATPGGRTSDGVGCESCHGAASGW